MVHCLGRGRRVRIISLSALLVSCAAAVRQIEAADAPPGPLPVGNQIAAELPGLHNVFRLSTNLYTGSVPEGDDGFQSLHRLGVKTVITVDGAQPDVERARKYGLRYVHLPFGYDGCPVPQANRIVRAVRDLPGPIYLHCHHGKHRSPTAAAFARIALDGVSNEQAISEMKRAGTGTNYIGLYGDVRAYHLPARADLEQVAPDFPEVAPTPPLQGAMVRIDERFGHLLTAQKAGWKATSGLPQPQPVHEALQLRELFAELNRRADIRQRPADFRQWLRGAERDTTTLEAALRSGQSDRATTALGQVAATCGNCHAKYRDIPQTRSERVTNGP